LIYSECANPLASILSAIESLKQEEPVAEAQPAKETAAVVTASENKEAVTGEETGFDNQAISRSVQGKSRAASLAGDGKKE
jgi:hypothetical protein